MASKPILYIDFDGVIMNEVQGRYQSRPRVMEFLEWCVERFECRWFSHEQEKRIRAFFFGQFHEVLGDKITYCDIGNNKPDWINFAEDWYWLDDSDSWDWKGRGSLSTGRLVLVDWKSPLSLQDLVQPYLQRVSTPAVPRIREADSDSSGNRGQW